MQNRCCSHIVSSVKVTRKPFPVAPRCFQGSVSTATECSFPSMAVPCLTRQPLHLPLPDPTTQGPASWACRGQSLREDKVSWGKLQELSELPCPDVYLEDSKAAFLAGRAAVRMSRAHSRPTSAVTSNHRQGAPTYRNEFSHCSGGQMLRLCWLPLEAVRQTPSRASLWFLVAVSKCCWPP